MIREVTRAMWAIFEDGELFALFAQEDPARYIAREEDGDRVVEVPVTYVYDDSLTGRPS